MIEFKGELSDKCKKYLIDDSWKRVFFVVLIITIPIIVLTVFLTLNNGWEYSLIFVPIAVYMLVFLAKPTTKLYRFFWGKSGQIYDGKLQWDIIIEQDLISAEGIQRYETKSLEDVKKVVDMGDFYKIYFYFPNKSNLFSCQKSLLIKGTIEQFEQLFADKMIKNAEQGGIGE